MLFQTLTDWVTGRAPLGVTRAKEWPKRRKQYLKRYPNCSACNSTKKLEVHHIMPFHIDPRLELIESNLITLCRSCHYFVGHFKKWKKWNSQAVRDSEFWRTRILNESFVGL